MRLFLESTLQPDLINGIHLFQLNRTDPKQQRLKLSFDPTSKREGVIAQASTQNSTSRLLNMYILLIVFGASLFKL